MFCIPQTSFSHCERPIPQRGLFFEAFVPPGATFPLCTPPYAWVSYTFPIRLLKYWCFHLNFTIAGSKRHSGCISPCITAWGLLQLLFATRQGISWGQSLVLRGACGKWKSPLWTWYINRWNSHIAGERKFPAKFPLSQSQTDHWKSEVLDVLAPEELFILTSTGLTFSHGGEEVCGKARLGPLFLWPRHYFSFSIAKKTYLSSSHQKSSRSTKHWKLC